MVAADFRMKTIRNVLIVSVVVLARPACAQPTAFDPSLALAEHRVIPDAISYGTAATALALEAAHVWRADRVRGLERFALRVGLVVVGSEVVKRAVHRTRPDGSDDLSFWSEHTALACLSPSRWGMSLCAMTGAGRVAAGRHYVTDVAAGAAVGWVARR
jgi:membrane-associated phospholipid phosphatase